MAEKNTSNKPKRSWLNRAVGFVASALAMGKIEAKGKSSKRQAGLNPLKRVRLYNYGVSPEVFARTYRPNQAKRRKLLRSNPTLITKYLK